MWMNTQIVALNTTAQTYYTPWFPKGADNGVFTLEKILDTISGTAFAVRVFTKNKEDEGSLPGSAVGTFAVLGSSAFYEADCSELKDLVRFEIKFTAASAGQGVIFRFLPPTWYDTAV
jgi:hypothetical protein